MTDNCKSCQALRRKAKRLGILNWERMDVSDLVFWVDQAEASERARKVRKDLADAAT